LQSGSLNLLEPSGPVQACMGLLYLYLYLKISEHVCSQNTSVDLRSLGILRSAEWYFLTDVSGQPIGTMFKVQLPNETTTLRRVEFPKSTHLIYITAVGHA